MIQSLDVPVVSLAVPNIHKMNEITSDDLSCMWTVFTKCKDNLENGRRLENLSWRLWYRESLIEKAQEQNHVRTPIPIQSNNNMNNDDYFSYASSASTCESTPLQTPPSLKHMSPSSFKRMISSLDNDSIEKQHYQHQQLQQQSPIQLLPTSKLSSPTSSLSKMDSQSTSDATTTTVPSLTAPQPKKAFSVPKPQRKFFVSDDEESSDDDEAEEDPMTIQNKSYNNKNKIMDENDNDDGCWSTVRTTDDRHFYSTPPPSCSTIKADNNKITFSSVPTDSETNFIKKTPTCIAKQQHQQPSLLSAMLIEQQQQQQQQRKSSIRKKHYSSSSQKRRQRSMMNNNNNNNTITYIQEEPDLSQSLKYCVDWEQRQNVIDIHSTTTHYSPYQIQQKPLEVYNNYCWESFRGW
ncbi:hypothetical protein INT45_010633 [Circinella minor]|uniref:Nitrogen regulatory protein areA GATA-like domain-containing protein n=1 Tax=Circinella minor TaxID=1195481 RepID=A0A8H7RS40_9FUNG|nr:hypothetical protein INT45_010633 [Circinella minor]